MAWDSDSRYIDYTMTIGLNTYDKSDIIKIDTNEGVSGSRSIGMIVSASITAEIYTGNNIINKGDKVTLTVSENGGLGYGFGEFTVENVKKLGNVTNITAYDNFYKADEHIGKLSTGGQLVAVVNGVPVDRGYVLSDYMTEINRKLGTNLDSTSKRYRVIDTFPENTPMRTIMQDMATIDMSMFMISRYDNAVIIPAFQEGERVISHRLTPNDYYECEILEDTPDCYYVILNPGSEGLEFRSMLFNPKKAFAYNINYATQSMQFSMEMRLNNAYRDKNFKLTCRGDMTYRIGESISIEAEGGSIHLSRILGIQTSLAGGMTQTLSCTPLTGIGLDFYRDSTHSRFIAVKSNTEKIKKIDEALEVRKNTTTIRHNTEPYYEYGKALTGQPVSETSTIFEKDKMKMYVRTNGTMSQAEGTSETEIYQVDYTKSSGMEIDEGGLYHVIDDVETGEIEKVRIPKTYINTIEPDELVGSVGDICIVVPNEEPEEQPTEPEIGGV